MLQKSGGLFQLLAEVDFGTTYGLKSVYYKSRSSNIADAGQIRLARADVISFRNQANSANLDLGVSSSNALQFNGSDLLQVNLTDGNILVGSASNIATSVTMSGDATIINDGTLTIANDAVTNAKLAEMATLTIKGNSTGGSANPSDLSVATVTSMLNAFVGDSGSGGTKGLVPAPAAGDAAANKFLSAGGVWSVPAGAGDVTGPASATDNGFVRFDGTTGKVIKDSPATISNADVASNAAIAFSKLASLTSANILLGNGSNVATAVAVTGDVSITNSGVTGYNGIVPLNKGGSNKNLTAVSGGVVYTDSDSMEITSAGTAGQFLMSNGSSAPSFSNPAPAIYPITTKTTTYTATTADSVIYVTSASAWTLTLYAASGNAGRTLTIKKTSSDFNLVTIDGNASETIDGQTTTNVATQWECLTIICDGSNWNILDRKIDQSWISYTPTFTGFGSETNKSFRYRRVGENIDVIGTATAGAVGTGGEISLPSGLTIDSNIGSAIKKVGTWTTNSSTANNMKLFNVIASSTNTTTVYFSVSEYSQALSGLQSTNINQLIANSLNMSFYWSVPITGWKGN